MLHLFFLAKRLRRKEEKELMISLHFVGFLLFLYLSYNVGLLRYCGASLAVTLLLFFRATLFFQTFPLFLLG